MALVAEDQKLACINYLHKPLTQITWHLCTGGGLSRRCRPSCHQVARAWQLKHTGYSLQEYYYGLHINRYHSRSSFSFWHPVQFIHCLLSYSHSCIYIVLRSMHSILQTSVTLPAEMKSTCRCPTCNMLTMYGVCSVLPFPELNLVAR